MIFARNAAGTAYLDFTLQKKFCLNYNADTITRHKRILMNHWEIEKKIALKALKDPAFKKKLLTHPKEALKEVFEEEKNLSVLDKLHIKIYEEKKNEWIFSIPYLEENRRMSDQELEKIFAAGWNPMSIHCTV